MKSLVSPGEPTELAVGFGRETPGPLCGLHPEVRANRMRGAEPEEVVPPGLPMML